MDYKESRIRSADELELYMRLWKTSSPARAVVLLTHGHGEHIGRYNHVAQALAARGFLCFGYDLRGHGRSGGKKGFVRSWDDFRQDLSAVLNQAQAEASQLPIFLYGHSIGGTISLDFAMKHPKGIRGVIVSGPVLGKPNIPEILFTLSKLLSRVYPSFSMATQLETNALSRDPAVVQAYEEDPLVHSMGTPRMGTELTTTLEWLHEQANEWSLPLLILHGAKDRICNPEDGKRFFDRVSIEDKTYLELADGFHEPHNDLDQDIVIQRIGDWIESHL